MSLYAADGSINVTVVDGTTLTGLYSPAGAWNVIQATPGAPHGTIHSCGALRVTVVASGLTGAYAPDGSLYVVATPYEASGPTRVTVLSGEFFVAPIFGTDLTITGTGTVGQTLTAAYASDDDTLSTQWYRDDVAITGATDGTYLLVAEDVGTIISVTVTIGNPVYTDSQTAALADVIVAA